MLHERDPSNGNENFSLEADRERDQSQDIKYRRLNAKLGRRLTDERER